MSPKMLIIASLLAVTVIVESLPQSSRAISGVRLGLNDKCDKDNDKCGPGLQCVDEKDDPICDKDPIDDDCCRPGTKDKKST